MKASVPRSAVPLHNYFVPLQINPNGDGAVLVLCQSIHDLQREEDLYLRLGILKGRVDYAISDDYSLAAVNGDMVDAGLQASLELSLCLHGEPLALKKQDLPPEVMANLSPLERQKTQCELAGEHLARGAFDLHTLDILDAIEASRNISALVQPSWPDLFAT